MILYMDDRRLITGKLGESIAEKFLKKKGFSILEKNHKTPFGEIDIIAKKDLFLVFFEIKTRISEGHGPPLEAINTEKRKHIIKNCLYYLKIQRLENCACRIDVIGIKLNAEGKLEILRHVRNAIELI